MSGYTTELRYICESLAGYKHSTSDVERVIDLSRTKIFSFDYPIFDADYKPVIERKILRHYYTREIGFETYGLFKLKLNTKMNDIMPYYNQLYESERIKFDPLQDFSYDRTYKKDSAGTTTSNNKTGINADAENINKYSDTPQGGLNGLLSDEYLTSANVQEYSGASTKISNGDGTSKNTDEYLEHLSGKHGATPYSTLIREYRKIFLNIDMDIINELEDLFFKLW